MIRGRFARRWLLLGVVMFCTIYAAVYLSTLHEFNVKISLNKPRRHNPPPLPWELPDANDAEKLLINRVPKGHPDSLQNITEKIKSENKDSESKIEQKDSNLDEEAKEPEKQDFMTTQAKINKRRREVLRQKCANHPEMSKGAISDNTYRHIYVNDKHKLLYCFVPKVGCSNWKRVLMVINGHQKKISEMSSDEVHFNNGMKRLAGFPKSERQRKLESYKTFMYARNPFVRVLSAFNNKYGDVVQYRKETYFQGFAKTIMKKFRPGATRRELQTGENITWTEFVKFLTQPQRPFFDDHWEEMYKLCSPCRINYDYIGHLETVADDAKYMLTDLDLDSLVEFPSRSNSHPTNSTAEFEKAYKELPAENLDKLWRIFEKDFNFFDYPKPSFIKG